MPAITPAPADSLRALYTEARRLGLLADPHIRALVTSLLREPDADYERILHERVGRARLADLLCPHPLEAFTPTREEAAGEVPIGHVIGTGFVYGINTSERHHILLGATGSGKSWLSRKIAKHQIARGERCIIFSKKRDARSIASLFANRAVLFRLTDRDFHYNPKEGGPGITLLQANTDFCEILCQSESLLLGSSNYILAALAELDELLGTNQDPSRQASLFEIREHIARKKHNAVSREARFRESILNRLDGLLASLGPVFACSQGFPIEQALNDGWSLIIEVDGVKEEIALLLTTSLTLRLFTWMLHSAAPRPNSLTILLDDSQEVFSANHERRPEEGLPVMGLMAARFRVAGLLVASTQVPQLTSTMLRQNCSTKVIFTQNDLPEALTAAGMIGLPERDAGELLRLKPGEAVCFKPTYPYPVKVRVAPDPDIKE